MDEENYEFGKVVELLQKQFAKMVLMKQKLTDFVFAKLGGSDQQLLKEVFAGQPHETTMQRVWRGHISAPFALSSHVADLQRHFRIVRVSEEPLQISWFLYGSIEARRSAKVSFRTL